MSDENHDPGDVSPDVSPDESPPVGYDDPHDPNDGQSHWATPGSASAEQDQFQRPDPLLDFDQQHPALTHGGLDVPGLSLPTSITDPTAHPAGDPNSLSPGLFQPLPAEPHRHPSTIPEKVYDAVTNPAPPPAPPEDPTELERQRQQKASENAIGQHTPMTPEIRF